MSGVKLDVDREIPAIMPGEENRRNQLLPTQNGAKHGSGRIIRHGGGDQPDAASPERFVQQHRILSIAAENLPPGSGGDSANIVNRDRAPEQLRPGKPGVKFGNGSIQVIGILQTIEYPLPVNREAVFILLHELPADNQGTAPAHKLQQTFRRLRIDCANSCRDNRPVAILPPFCKLFFQENIDRVVREFQRASIIDEFHLDVLAGNAGHPFGRIGKENSNIAFHIAVARQEELGEPENLPFRLMNCRQFRSRHIVRVQEIVGTAFRQFSAPLLVERVPVYRAGSPVEQIGRIAPPDMVQPEVGEDVSVGSARVHLLILHGFSVGEGAVEVAFHHPVEKCQRI